jgi:ubiquinol-cytochrome c reductase cytochrome b subunit
MEKDGNGSRFAFYQEKTNGEYLLWLHQVISSLGYSKPEIPIIQTRKGTNGQIRYSYRFRTYTYSSFNWIYEEFYPKFFKNLGRRTVGPLGLKAGGDLHLSKKVNQRKVVPRIIDQYLSPLALAVWIMDDATLYKNKGLRFCTNCFTLKEVQYLASVLEKKYSLNTSIHKTGVVNQYGLYIPKSSMANLTKIVKPHIHPTMLYKLLSI